MSPHHQFFQLSGTLLGVVGYDGAIRQVSRAWTELLDYPEDELIGRPLLECITAEERSQVAELLAQLVHDGGTARFVAHSSDRLGQRHALAWDAVAEPAEGQIYIAARPADAAESVTSDAFHDLLTGLPNRSLYLERLAHNLERARRRDDFRFAVLYLGLDRFKVINDSLGHKMGDMLLIGVTGVLRQCIRPTDMVARLGGDEFALLLEDIRDASSTLRVVQRIQERLTLPFRLAEHEVFTNVSIGIALSTSDYGEADQCVRDANIAMYRAKAQGGAGYVVFDKAMHDQAVRRMQLEMDLRRAVEHDEFQAYYQPIIDLPSGELVGFEALVRWMHPSRGLVPPVEFIPAAEETGLIIPIGRWMLRESCRQLRCWNDEFPDRPPLTVNVNLSPKQLQSARLLDEVAAILAESAIDPHQLKLEITESAIMEDGERAIELLRKLKEMSIRLCLDDFGTGYSSLSYLHRLPLDVLKIDRAFVKSIVGNPTDISFVRTILALAHQLDLQVVCEGIETAEQEALLRELGCDLGQGYLYSRPVAASEAQLFIVTGR